MRLGLALVAFVAAGTIKVYQGGQQVGPPRPAINFVGANCADDPTAGSTTCVIPSITGATAQVPPGVVAPIVFDVPAAWVQALPAAIMCEPEGSTPASAQIVSRNPGVGLTVMVWSNYPLLDSSLVIDCLGGSQ